MRLPRSFVAIGLAIVGTPSLAEELRITHGPYLQQPTETSIAVVWFTNLKCASKVEYGIGERLDATALSSRHGLIDANTQRHCISMPDLKPGTTYCYRVVSTEILDFKPYEVTYGKRVVSDTYRFTTLDVNKTSFSFLAVNDIHNKDGRLTAMMKGVPWDGVDLVFLNGDMVDHFDADAQIFGGFLDACVNTFAKTTPFILVRGNHETRGAAARRLMDFFPSATGRFYHALDHGGVHFVILDSGEDKPDSSKEYSGLVAFDAYRAEQAEWLKSDLRSDASRKANFRIALFHMPPYGGNNWHGETHLRKLWGPILNEWRVDLVICGHTHRFNRINPSPERNLYTLVIGGADTVIRGDVTGKKLAVTVTRLDREPLDTILIPAR